MNNGQNVRIFFAIACIVSGTSIEIQPFSTLTRNDPYPLFSTTYPYSYLLDNTKNYLKGFDECYDRQHFYLAFTGIYQKASVGSNYDRIKNLPIGDLEGRWAMLSMIYGTATPGPGVTPEEIGPQLQFAKEILFPDIDPLDTIPDEEIQIDTNQEIGFFSAPIKYRKHAVRFEMAAQPHEDFGILIQGGWADIKQTLTNPVNLATDTTPNPDEFTLSVTVINSVLMSTSSRNAVFKQQGLDPFSNTQNMNDYREGSFEDLRFSVWLRHIFQANCDRECEWPPFLFIPFIFLEGSICPSRVFDEQRPLLAVPFGNDRHTSIGFTAGFNIDLRETLEIGFHGGIMHFNSRTVHDYRLPTHPTQTGLYPFATDVKLHPGNNHHFAVSVHGYRFIGKLSGWVEFEYVNHARDNIRIINEEVANNPDIFIVGQQESLTKFSSQFLTTVMNYEISPNFMLGFGVQWPLQQRNAYRSTTVLGTIRATF
ncbi:MAG: hypothetical protein WCE21_04185 [Candidatus Babeliales bacterium]